ncbi:MAG TPA: hypothetical protein VFQ33_04370, partial [Xanthobacteraceae bacterium]|nr:hypothetical protein [Xanthobacteraceae bacterium]
RVGWWFVIEVSEPTASQARIGASRSGPATLRFDPELSRPEKPMSPLRPERVRSQPPSEPLWP